MWIALLAWRSPPRLSRWRTVLPEEAGIGAVPLQRAKAASFLKRRRVAGEQLRGRDRADPGFVEQRRIERADERGELVLVALASAASVA